MCSFLGDLVKICAVWIAICIYITESVTVMKQQYFRKEPVSISAAVGSNVTLECEVESRSGFVQWTKDGYALGFNKTIPGFPTYTFNADNSLGVFNLHIQSVSLEDDSEFQCQVGPSQLPLMHKPIRAGANLTVISPPLSIEIVGHENSSKYEVQENSSIKLQCIARDAKPAARIVWYRGRSELTSINREGNVTSSEIVKKEKKYRLYHVTSEIHLQPNVDDDGVNYTCEAEHEALVGKRMRATVQLSVLYPPGVPYIKGYTEGNVLLKGQDVELICLSRGGNPPAQLVWYKNGEQVKAIYRPVGRVSENVYSFKADVSDNKARLMCEASSVINNTRLTIEVNLTVYYAPVSVIVNGSSEARGGDTVPLSCTAGPSNPAATIKWEINSVQVENSVTRTVPYSNNGWISYSNTTVFIPYNATFLSVQCYGVNSHITNEPQKLFSHTITVLRPPGVPILTGIDETKYVASGTKKTLTCTSVGGHPLATLTLFQNDKEIPFTSPPEKKEGSMTATAVISVSDSDNEAVYKCEAKNSATSIPYSKTLKMTVYFPPMGAKITSPRPEELKAGSMTKLICEIGSSNPEPAVSWWVDGMEVKEGVTKSCKSGLYGGQVCVTELPLNLTSDMDGQRYICQAVNEPLGKSASSAIVLNVHYKPVISDLNETVFTEVEGNNLVISLQVSANPSKVRYTWSKDGGPLMQNFDSKLNITQLHRSHSGLYSCEAFNSLGSSLIEFRVIVLYPASILHVSDVVLVADRQTATLNCTVDGNPLSSEHVYWKRDGFPMAAKTRSSFANITSSLTVYNVTLNDMGNFYCVVDNGIGSESNKSAFLVVKHKPIIDKSDALSKAAAQIGNDAKLVCIASGAPKVSFSWSKGGTKLPQNTTEKYTMYYEQWDVIHHKSTLRIHNVAHQDYEKYGCKADNSIGSSAHLVTLQNVSHPDPPSDFEALNATHNSITLTWKPGFNGGETSSYQIRFTEADEDRLSYRTLSAGSETVFTVSKLNLATCYTFNILAYNKHGRSNYMRNELKACSLSEGPPSLPSRGGMANETNSIRLPFAVGFVIAGILIILNGSVVIFCVIRRTKNKCKDNAHQQANKSENTDLYSSNNFNDQLHAESITSVSEKSENCDKGYNPLDEGRCSALNTYLIEEIDYPFQDTSAYEIEVKPEKLSSYHHRTSTICRNGSLCQRIDANTISIPGDPQFIAYPPPVQFAQCSLEYMSNPRGHILGPPPDVTVQTAQNVPLSTFNYNAEHDGQLV